MTNYDRIKAMSIEEMAKLLDDFTACNHCLRRGNKCFPYYDTKKWLEQKVERED